HRPPAGSALPTYSDECSCVAPHLGGRASSGVTRSRRDRFGGASRPRLPATVMGMAEETATTYFEELSALDAFFLYAERDEAPLHIGAVYVFEDAGGRGARGIALTLEERLHLVP